MEHSLEALIPDLPLKEFAPAGFAAFSPWDKLSLKVCWGYSERLRRVWVNPDQPRQSPLVISCEIETTHCHRDAENLLHAVQRSEEAISTVRLLGIELNDRLSKGESSFVWRNHGLTFQRLVFVDGRYIGEVSSVAFDNEGQLDGEAGASIREKLGSSDDQHDQGCKHSLFLRPAWGTAAAVPILVPMFMAGTIAAAIESSGLLSLVVSLAVGVTIGWWLVGWRSRRQLRKIRTVWKQIFHQGDNDGTMRRALSSIGVQLPPLPRP